MRALCAASVLGGLAQSLAGAAGSLLARRVSHSDAVAGLPQTMLVLGNAGAALGSSRLTRRFGRGPALAAGAATAVVGCGVVTVASGLASVAMILAGSVLLGAGNASVMLSRYAAADLGAEAGRARAMASVLVATTIGAVAGPNLLAPASRLAAGLGIRPLAGPYVVASAGFAAAMWVLAVGLRAGGPAGRMPAVSARRRVPVGRQQLAGLGVLAVANLVMVSVMTMAPLQLRQTGSGLGAIGLVVSLHVAGMFAPSPLSGWLTGRIGRGPAATAAGALLVAASSLAAVGAGDTIVLAIAMVLLGIGWNLSLIAGSTLLTADVPAAQRPRREGWGEATMGLAAAGGGGASGAVMAGGGYSTLAAAAAIVACLVLPLALRRPIVAGPR